MNQFAEDPQRTVAVFLNDFDQEFADGLQKLSAKLGRELTGLIVVDKKLKETNQYVQDKNGVFAQEVCDFEDDMALRKLAKSLEGKLLLVTCSSERNQPYMKRILPHVPYVLGPTESSLDWATFKVKMREMLGAYSPHLVPKVAQVVKGDEAEIQSILSNLSFPVIVKPAGLAASVLVSRADDEAELRKVLAESMAVLGEIYVRDRGRGTPSMIVEEFIEGDMYAVDVYVDQTGKVSPLPLFRSKTGFAAGLSGFHIYEEGSYLELTEEQKQAGYQAATEAMHSLGLRSCVGHIELFHTKDGWKIIELGPRAGGQRQFMYEAAYGIDHGYNELLVKVGLEPEITYTPISNITIVRFYADEEGILTGVQGFEEAKANPSIYNFRMRAEIGDLVAPSDGGGKAVVDGVLSNPDLDQLAKDVNTVRSLIKVLTKPAA